MGFRLLRADEIDVRISQVTKAGVALLLYKDARCDQNILDESVGPMNWQRHHTRDNANCIVSLWDDEKKQWIDKEDTGTESYTEKEKGLASDSFKRACFNWGIGRELYTAPNMFVYVKDLATFKSEGERYKCFDNFTVTAIEYDGRRIAMVELRNEKTKKLLQFGEPVEETRKTEEAGSMKIGRVKGKALFDLCQEKHVRVESILEKYGVEKLEDLTERQHLAIHGWISTLNETNGKD